MPLKTSEKENNNWLLINLVKFCSQFLLANNNKATREKRMNS